MDRIIIAAAGAGKTQHIVEKAYGSKEPVLLTTYTEENTLEISSRFFKLYGQIPKNVVILPWYTFLLRFLIKPYQNIFCPQNITGTLQVNGVSAKGTKKDSLEHYFTSNMRLYTDKVGELAYKLNDDFNGFPLENLSRIFSHIYIDEMQDMGGYDIELLKAFIQSPLNITAVGDPRQSTFLTSYGPINKGKNRINLLDSFTKLKVEIDTKTLNINHRCCSQICDYSNSLYPDFSPAQSDAVYEDNHQGIFIVKPQDVRGYIDLYHPCQLIYRKNSKYYCKDIHYISIGKSKGKSYYRTLLFIPDTFCEFIFKGVKNFAPKSLADLYIALTRAMASVAIVYDYGDDFKSDIFIPYQLVDIP